MTDTERAAAVWSRFQVDYPGYRGGTYTDAVEGPLWVIQNGKVVEVRTKEWEGKVRIRDVAREQAGLGL